MNSFLNRDLGGGGGVKVELDLSNYATEGDFKYAAAVNTFKSAKKNELARLKSEIEKLDIDKSETVPVNLNKSSDVVKNEVVVKTRYDE